ncbi:MAG: site-specific integrase [Nitrososphaerales archaeon]
MTVLRQRMIEDMQLRGLASRTQEASVAAVEQLAKYYHRSPNEVGEEELRQYLLYLENEKVVSASTMTVALCGLKFLYQHTLQRERHLLDLVRAKQEEKSGGLGVPKSRVYGVLHACTLSDGSGVLRPATEARRLEEARRRAAKAEAKGREAARPGA